MTPSEFKSRFIELLPPIPAELDLNVGEFVTFPADLARALRVSDLDRSFLTDSGLPWDAAPFLSFDPDYALAPVDGLPGSAIIGHNGSGDMICIDQAADGAVVYYNHDNHMERVFVNSSLSQFAESLCAYSAYRQSKDKQDFFLAMLKIDPDAIVPRAFWACELG
jgi:SUKH-4 immunity protein